MKKIETYSFGKMVYGGTTYTADLIITPHNVYSPWWRRQGHLLQMEDLAEILEEISANSNGMTGLLIVGTGAMGQMRVPEKLREQLKQLNLRLTVDNSEKAVQIFNSTVEPGNVFAAFHLTC
ncbi:MAG: hypothetical protein GY757_02195 [bacterium]|nr:hypothetical protein [bacterium]